MTKWELRDAGDARLRGYVLDTIPCRVKTPLEVASSGLRLNKTKKLSVFFFGGEKGRGVVSEENIPAGHFVCEYKYSKSYPMKEREEMVRVYEANGEGSYIMEVQAGNKKLCLDATVNVDSWGRYINHANCNQANLRMHPALFVRGKWRVAFLARRDIMAGEELSYDYGLLKGRPEWMSRKKVSAIL